MLKAWKNWGKFHESGLKLSRSSSCKLLFFTAWLGWDWFSSFKMFKADLVKYVFQKAVTKCSVRILELHAKIYTWLKIPLLINEYDEKFLIHLHCWKTIPKKVQNDNINFFLLTLLLFLQPDPFMIHFLSKSSQIFMCA